ncbi:unnamed protein product [Rhizophagus irregularis]|nr:unnamed protein product [Rhizophagus irregularis]
MLFASSTDNAELGVWRGKGRAEAREEEEKETERSLLRDWAPWEAVGFGCPLFELEPLLRLLAEADLSRDMERERERELEVAR